MGKVFCGSHRRQCCDGCDACPSCAGRIFSLRLFRCPFGWCPPVRVCPECIAKHGINENRREKHASCARYSARFQAELDAQKAAASMGLPVIKAGVSTRDGKVFAWTTTGNYRVPSADYHEALQRQDNVLSLEHAVRTADEYPPEVYGQRKE